VLRGKHMAERHLVDTLQIGTDSKSSWTASPTWTWDTAKTVPCFVDDSESSEVADGTETTITDACVFVPIGTAITNVNRIKVTHRYREALATAEIYRVIGAPQVRRSLLALHCKRVTGNARG